VSAESNDELRHRGARAGDAAKARRGVGDCSDGPAHDHAPVAPALHAAFDRKGLPDPLLMDHAFKIADGKIAELKVSFASEG